MCSRNSAGASQCVTPAFTVQWVTAARSSRAFTARLRSWCQGTSQLARSVLSKAMARTALAPGPTTSATRSRTAGCASSWAISGWSGATRADSSWVARIASKSATARARSTPEPSSSA